MPTYYDVLGINESATHDEIKKAHRVAVKKYHPDINGTSQAEEMFKLIQEAYETLIDENLRKNYDFMIKIRKHQEEEKAKKYQQTKQESYDRPKEAEPSFKEPKKTQQHQKQTVSASNDSNVPNNRKKERRTFSGRTPVLHFSLISALRKIVYILLLLVIPASIAYLQQGFNEMLLYYGWLIVFFVFSKLVFAFLSIVIVICFISGLLQGEGTYVLISVLAFITLYFIFFLIKPDMFE